MRNPLWFALAALMTAPAPGQGNSTHAAWMWERTIVPNAASPTAEQCSILDADLFARAAPGLRDVRMLQDGRELAYATDISLDEPGSRAATVPQVDRSQYEVALAVPAYPSQWAGAPRKGYTSSRPEHLPGWFYGEGLLPAHVPVERLRLDSFAKGTEFFSMSAAEANGRPDAETLEATLTPEHPAVAFTVGANLQRAADIRLAVHGDALGVTSFVLEMRRREICYQPLTGSPIALLFGNAAALPVHYDYGKHYQPKAAPLLSSMGPTQPNPAFRAMSARRSRLPLRAKLIVAVLACALALMLTLRPLLRAKR